MTASIETGMIVEKKVFELQHFTTSLGATLKSVRVGVQLAVAFPADPDGLERSPAGCGEVL